jgi:hypothetical protein
LARIGDTARITLQGLDTSVNQDSPLADQIALIFKAMSQHALRNGWQVTVYRGDPGFKGTFVMKHLIEDLFPNADRETRDAISTIAGSVLRNTNAAVCVHRPIPGSHDRPIWFVANQMPDNLAMAATDYRPPARLTAIERRLTPHESGENREPAPVEVTQVAKKTDEGFEPEKLTEESDLTPPSGDVVVNDRFIEDIYEQIATCPVPVTIPELVQFVEKPTWAVRGATERLLEASRITWREETTDEKRVRGGGQLPPARKSRLFWTAPGPVPIREVLPPGIEPMRSSREQAQERVGRMRSEEAAILKYLEHPDNYQRTSGKIAEHTGLELERAKSGLNRMVQAGKLRRSKGGQYYHVKPGDPAPPPPPAEDWPEAPMVAVNPPGAIDWAEPAKDPAALIHRLVDELAARPSAENVLKARIAELERENAEMTRLLDKFKKLLD